MEPHLFLLAAAAAAVSPGCDPDDPPVRIEPTYANVAETIGESCALSRSCHGAATGAGDLTFGRTDDYTTVLIDVPSCQYGAMPRVDPGDPDNSWLMIKLAGVHDPSGNIEFTPSATWIPSLTPGNTECPLNDGTRVTGFGGLMPPSPDEPSPLSDAQIAMFREWIAGGAPGP
jgi:hypothetical protein